MTSWQGDRVTSWQGESRSKKNSLFFLTPSHALLTKNLGFSKTENYALWCDDYDYLKFYIIRKPKYFPFEIYEFRISTCVMIRYETQQEQSWRGRNCKLFMSYIVVSYIAIYTWLSGSELYSHVYMAI